MTLKEVGFKVTEVAEGEGVKVAIGLLGDGTPVLVAHTAKGEGYTPYISLMAAGSAFDEIVKLKGLTELVVS